MTRLQSCSNPARNCLGALLALAAVFVMGACGNSSKSSTAPVTNGPGGNQLTVQGSDTMAKLVQAWTLEYMKAHAQAQINVRSGDTGSGIRALIDRQINVAAASRELTEAESMIAHDKGVRLMRTMVARDAVAVIVSAANPIPSITLPDLKSIYAGTTTKWNQIKGYPATKGDAPIMVLGREISSGTGEFLRENVLNGQEYGANVKLLTSTDEVVDMVENNVGAIGFVGISHAEAAGKKVKIVAVRLNAQADDDAKEDTVTGSDYPLSRPLYMYCDANGGELTKSFVEYCKSAQGQVAVKKLGFLPLY